MIYDVHVIVSIVAALWAPRSALAAGIKGSFAHQDVVPLQSSCGITSCSTVYFCHITIIKPRQTWQTQCKQGHWDGLMPRCHPTLEADLAEEVAWEICPHTRKNPFICQIHLLLLSAAWFNEHSLLGEAARQSSTPTDSSRGYFMSLIFFCVCAQVCVAHFIGFTYFSFSSPFIAILTKSRNQCKLVIYTSISILFSPPHCGFQVFGL